MAEETIGVKQEQASNAATEPTVENAQETTVTGDVQNPVSDGGVDMASVIEKTKSHLSNVNAALKTEREDRRAAIAERDAALERLSQLEDGETDNHTPTTHNSPGKMTSEAEERLRLLEESNAIATKHSTDPSFKDREDLVKGLAGEQGLSIEQADTIVKAKMMEEVLKNASQQSDSPVAPKTINQKATQDSTPKTPTQSENRLKEFLDNPNVPETAKRAIRDSGRYGI